MGPRLALLGSLLGAAAGQTAPAEPQTFKCEDSGLLTATSTESVVTAVIAASYGNCAKGDDGFDFEITDEGTDKKFTFTIDPVKCLDSGADKNKHVINTELGRVSSTGQSLWMKNVNFESGCDYKTEYDIVYEYGMLVADTATFNGTSGEKEFTIKIKVFEETFTNELDNPPRLGGRPIYLGLVIEDSAFDHCERSFAVSQCDMHAEIQGQSVDYTIFSPDTQCKNDDVGLAIGFKPEKTIRMWTITHLLFLLGNIGEHEAKLTCKVSVCDQHEVGNKCDDIAETCLGDKSALHLSDCPLPDLPEQTSTSDPCNPSPCVHSNICNAQSDGSVKCGTEHNGEFHCEAGFEGDLCDTATIHCPGVCGENSNHCEEGVGTFDCDCKGGWRGSVCDVPPETITELDAFVMFETDADKADVDATVAPQVGESLKANAEKIFAGDSTFKGVTLVDTDVTCDNGVCVVTATATLAFVMNEADVAAVQEFIDNELSGASRRRKRGIEDTRDKVMQVCDAAADAGKNICENSLGKTFTIAEKGIKSARNRDDHDSCYDLPCGHGTCTDNSDFAEFARTCTCYSGYAHDAIGACNVAEDYCATNSCPDGETCVNAIGKHQCIPDVPLASFQAGASTATEAACTDQLPQANEWKHLPNDHSVAYLKVTDRKTWVEADQYCKDLGQGVTLATLLNQEENDFVYNLNPGSWFGLQCFVDKSNDCTWVTGEKATFLAFDGPQQPDKICSSSNPFGMWTPNSPTTGNCAYFYTPKKWDDYCCGTEDPKRDYKPFTCMIRGCPVHKAEPSIEDCQHYQADPNWKRLGDALFWANTENHDYQESYDACYNLGNGATLAAPLSTEENDFVSAMTGGARTYMGFKCWEPGHEQECMRPDGHVMEYNHWNSVANGGRWETCPDHSGKCVITNFFGQGWWDDIICTYQAKSVCEVRGCPEHPVDHPTTAGVGKPCGCDTGNTEIFSDAAPAKSGFLPGDELGTVDVSKDGYVVEFDLEISDFGDGHQWRGIVWIGNKMELRQPGLWLKAGHEKSLELRHNQYEQWGTQTGWPDSLFDNPGFELNKLYSVRIAAVHDADCLTGASVSVCISGQQYMYRCLKKDTLLKDLAAQKVYIGGAAKNTGEASMTITNFKISQPANEMPSCQPHEGHGSTDDPDFLKPLKAGDQCQETYEFTTYGYTTKASWLNNLWPMSIILSEMFGLRVHNALTQDITVFWITNFRMTETGIAFIPAGGTANMQTYVGHQFAIRAGNNDPQGELLQVFMVNEHQRLVATATSNNFEVTQSDVDFFNNNGQCDDVFHFESYVCAEPKMMGGSPPSAIAAQCLDGCTVDSPPYGPPDAEGFMTGRNYFGWSAIGASLSPNNIMMQWEFAADQPLTLEFTSIDSRTGKAVWTGFGTYDNGQTATIFTSVGTVWHAKDATGKVVAAWIVKPDSTHISIDTAKVALFASHEGCWTASDFLPADYNPGAAAPACNTMEYTRHAGTCGAEDDFILDEPGKDIADYTGLTSDLIAGGVNTDFIEWFAWNNGILVNPNAASKPKGGYMAFCTEDGHYINFFAAAPYGISFICPGNNDPECGTFGQMEINHKYPKVCMVGGARTCSRGPLEQMKTNQRPSPPSTTENYCVQALSRDYTTGIYVKTSLLEVAPSCNEYSTQAGTCIDALDFIIDARAQTVSGYTALTSTLINGAIGAKFVDFFAAIKGITVNPNAAANPDGGWMAFCTEDNQYIKFWDTDDIAFICPANNDPECKDGDSKFWDMTPGHVYPKVCNVQTDECFRNSVAKMTTGHWSTPRDVTLSYCEANRSKNSVVNIYVKDSLL